VRRPTPEELLKKIEAEERKETRGKLKIFLGYASGVGKSFRMLDEGRRRKKRGEDVVVAATQASAPEEIDALLREMEVIPARILAGLAAIDVPAVLRRNPRVCLIDGLAHHNPPGSQHPERWQDVDELLDAGISVITSINLQYIAELQEKVAQIRGKRVRDSVPEAFIRTADEIEMVDAPPEYCVNRALSGDGSSGTDPLEMAHQLSALREIALLLAADVVDRQLEASLQQQGIDQLYGTHERVLVCVTPRSSAAVMIERGRRQVDRFHGDLYVVYVDMGTLKPADQDQLDRNLSLAREANAHVETLHGEDAVTAILNFAAKHGITQIFVGHSLKHGWSDRWKKNPVERLILEAEGIDIRIFPTAGSVAETVPVAG